MKKIFTVVIIFLSFILTQSVYPQRLIPVGKGWSNNSVNVTVFRKNSLVTHRNIQFIAFYDAEGYMNLGKRGYGTSEWEIKRTQYKGNVKDAHNIISIMVDGDGYLHASWDHHGHPLRYAKSIAPFSLELGEKQSMTGVNETNVTYPEFFCLAGGNLIFMYRDGQSGRGNLIMKRYDIKSKKWEDLHENLINGEGQRNAYWQACTDNNGTIHISWVWRNTPDVATNHDMCYARSKDGGLTWENSKCEKYDLPITASTAEIACPIPQNSELINQTSITADTYGNPYIATYWREHDSEVPQYHIIYNDGKKWNSLNLGFRETAFSLKGSGTKRIPVSRPQVVAKKDGKKTTLALLFRDEERDSRVSVAVLRDLKKNLWHIKDLTDFSVGSWEPSFDTQLWQNKQLLHIFVQNAEQIDGEGQADIQPQTVYVLELDDL